MLSRTLQSKERLKKYELLLLLLLEVIVSITPYKTIKTTPFSVISRLYAVLTWFIAHGYGFCNRVNRILVSCPGSISPQKASIRKEAENHTSESWKADHIEDEIYGIDPEIPV